MKTFEKVKFNGTFRVYQQRVLDKADKYLLDGRINVVAAPGSGKTILGLELIRRLNAPAVILSPTTTIKYQWGARFAGNFLEKGEDPAEYFSYDLHEITLLNSITYQALHSAMDHAPVEEDGVTVDYSDVDIFRIIKEYGVKTICLDEAHHLQNEWQKALEKFLDGIGRDVKIIALTATPPYDAGQTEWERYERVCGPIDEEIFVPELVNDKTLCPHQDYVYFNYPTKEETASFKDYRSKVVTGLDELMALPIYPKVYEYIASQYQEDRETLYENTRGVIATLILLNSFGIAVDETIVKSFTGKKKLPGLTVEFSERAYRFLLESDILNEDEKNEIRRVLKGNGLTERGQPVFSLKENAKHKLLSSVGKLKSITEIVKSESGNLGDALRLLILTDYIKKETVKDLFSGKTPSDVSVVSIFECLAKSDPSYRMGVLSGGLIILPTDCKQYLEHLGAKITQIGDTNYSEFSFGTVKNKDKVDAVSELFERGIIRILIGTKALLGEGWDSPCINTLILASFVGSFMLSNQMRGRAIRIDKNNPNKVSNIWHLVTLEPDYVFEDSALNAHALKRQTDFDRIVSYDYETLERRFECFTGPNYTTGEIENGIERLTAIRPPFDEKGVERINREMLSRAMQRDDTQSKWSTSLHQCGTKLTEEISVPKETVIKPVVFTNYLALVMLCSVDAVVMMAEIAALKTLVGVQNAPVTRLLPGLALFGLLLAATIAAAKQARKIILHSTPRKTMTHLANALLKTLKECNMIEYRASVVSGGSDVSVYLLLKNASTYEANLFNTAVSEMLSPIDNPRYILILKKRGRPCYEQSYACPSILGQKKEMVELFADNLTGRIGDFAIVYTRNDVGRAILLKAKKHALISKSEAQSPKRRRKISRYE